MASRLEFTTVSVWFGLLITVEKKKKNQLSLSLYFSLTQFLLVNVRLRSSVSRSETANRHFDACVVAVEGERQTTPGCHRRYISTRQFPVTAVWRNWFRQRGLCSAVVLIISPICVWLEWSCRMYWCDTLPQAWAEINLHKRVREPASIKTQTTRTRSLIKKKQYAQA